MSPNAAPWPEQFQVSTCFELDAGRATRVAEKRPASHTLLSTSFFIPEDRGSGKPVFTPLSRERGSSGSLGWLIDDRRGSGAHCLSFLWRKSHENAALGVPSRTIRSNNRLSDDRHGAHFAQAQAGVPVPDDSPVYNAFKQLEKQGSYRIRMTMESNDPRTAQMAGMGMGLGSLETLVKGSTRQVSPR